MNQRSGGGSAGLISLLAARSAFQPDRAGEEGGLPGRCQTVEPPPGRQIKRKEGLLSPGAGSGSTAGAWRWLVFREPRLS